MHGAQPSHLNGFLINPSRGSSLVEMLVVTLVLMCSVGMFSDVWVRNLASIDIYQTESELWDESDAIIRLFTGTVRTAALVQVADKGDRFSVYDTTGKLAATISLEPDGKLLLQTGKHERVLSRSVEASRSRFVQKGKGVESLITLKTQAVANEYVEVPVHIEVYPRN